MSFKTILIFFSATIATISVCNSEIKNVNADNLETETSTLQPNCTCVPFFQCNDKTNEIIVDGEGLLDYREFKNQCTGYFDVCCNLPKDIFKTTTESIEKSYEGCGYNPINSTTFPWSGALLFQKGKTTPSFYKCGFSVIHQKVGLTAAHCLLREDSDDDDDGRYVVQIGRLIRFVVATITHPNFNPSTLQNDIALLFFNNPIPLDATTTICIPPPHIILNNDTKCIVTNKRNSQQRIVVLPIVPRDVCLKALRKTRLGGFFQLHKSFLCAGGGQMDNTCDGDGGSALVCPVPGQIGRYHQVGIVSWGIRCGEETPGVYVNLGMFRGWIDKEMISRGFDITVYRY